MTPRSGRRLVVPDAAALARTGADLLASLLRDAVRERGRASLALSGGTTPGPVYRALASRSAADAAPWEHVEVFFGDERCVPPDDEQSNYLMARRDLLDLLPVPPLAVHRIRAEGPDRGRAAAAYAELLPPALDVLVLGMGPEGHIASIFPGSPALREERLVVPVETPKPPPWRLTVTPPVIAAARTVVVLVTGDAKVEAVERALAPDGDPGITPARLALQGTWILTRDAAPGLESS